MTVAVASAIQFASVSPSLTAGAVAVLGLDVVREAAANAVFVERVDRRGVLVQDLFDVGSVL